MSEIDDPSSWVVCGDNQEGGEYLQRAWNAVWGSPSVWEFSDDPVASYNFWHDINARKQYAPHLGGANFGFADGHAKWWNGQALVEAAGDCECCIPTQPVEGADVTDWYYPPQTLRGFCPDYEVINSLLPPD